MVTKDLSCMICILLQEEECNENFIKNCFIEYSKAAVNVTVDVCRTPLVKDCNKEGEEICATQYESECVTSQEKHEVTME